MGTGSSPVAEAESCVLCVVTCGLVRGWTSPCVFRGAGRRRGVGQVEEQREKADEAHQAGACRFVGQSRPAGEHNRVTLLPSFLRAVVGAYDQLCLFASASASNKSACIPASSRSLEQRRTSLSASLDTDHSYKLKHLAPASSTAFGDCGGLALSPPHPIRSHNLLLRLEQCRPLLVYSRGPRQPRGHGQSPIAKSLAPTQIPEQNRMTTV